MKRLSTNELRCLFFLFFLLLAIPAVILSNKAYEQLKWENFRQHQQAAQALARQIDNSLNSILLREESRSDTDYSFLNIAGEPQSGFIQRSYLSKFPVQSDFPGIIGYFQIDSFGQFSSPLLPRQSTQSSLYGISPEEQVQRSQLQFQVRSILSQNRLVRSHYNDESREKVVITDSSGRSSSLLEAEPTTIEEELAESVIRSSEKRKQAARSIAPLKEAELLIEPQDERVALESSHDNAIKSEAIEGDHGSFDSHPNSSNPKGKQPAKQSQYNSESLFDSLQSSQVQNQITQNVGKLDRYKYQQTNAKLKKDNVALTSKVSSKKRVARKEQSYLPTMPAILNQDQDQLKIDLFESKLEPFRFSLLSSDHLVVYRQVWRDGQRLIQGAVLTTDLFLQQTINDIFVSSSIYDFTRLKVFYGDRLLRSFAQLPERYFDRGRSIEEEELSAVRLAEPFNQLSLVFNITDIPDNKGANFILLVTLLLLMVITFGTFLFYRLTLKQLQLAQQQQDFISSVSHELKTPLTSIRMYGEILKQGWMSDEKRLEYYDYIYNESERLSRLISNVLQISKVSRNALDLNLKEKSTAELLDNLKSTIDSHVSQSGFSTAYNISGNASERILSIDSDAFQQIMINLIDNAIKYAGKSSNKTIDINVNLSKDNRVVLGIRDYGPGVASSQSKKIFELFYRTGDELTRESSGTGIGLALVKQLVEAMNGKVSVSHKKVGVEFLVEFPSVSIND